ncbi:ATP-binding protein [Undibacterium sp. TS12]|uniref:ATP-binding protein n=1 Tax=Undibacterium sp. TS12 TaxID=2908202 RepID=UPI001F4C9C6A|nr:ATP-binding protein [Undibacterium sp. TS12]MCH8618095.1 ATP-binding protein [Undibacterium sp. TS12]
MAADKDKKSMFFRRNMSLLAVTLLIVLAILAQSYWSVQQDKALTLQAESNNAHVAVRLLEEHVTQTMQDGVQKLDAIAAAVASFTHDTAAIHSLLASYDIQDNRYIKSLRYVDLQGNSWVSSPDFPAHQMRVADREDIRFLLKHPEHREVVIGNPYESRYDSQLVLPIARNIFDKNGKQLAMISTDIRIAYFADLYANVAKENNAMLALIANAGFIIVRSPFEARYVNRDISKEAATRNLEKLDNEGSFSDPSWLDDEVERLYVYRKVNGFPLTVVYGRDYESMLEPWQQRLQTRLVFTLAVIIFLLSVMGLLAIQVHKLRVSEATLRNAEYKFSEIFERSPLPLSLVNLNTRKIDAVNDAWIKLFGYRREEILTDTINYQKKFWADKEQLKRFTNMLRSESQVDLFQATLIHADGSHRICLLSSRTYLADGEERYIITPQDVTRQLAAEQDLLLLNASLEERVARRTENLERSNADLAAALDSLQMMQGELIRQEKLASLGSLVAGVAHELNTPIGNSVTVASTLQDEALRLQDETRQGMIKRSSFNTFLDNIVFGSDVLMRSLIRASELIRSFKHVAVDQSSDMRRDFDLRQALEEILLTNSSLYTKTPYEMKTDLQEGISMNSFPGALGQIIGNFVTNAIRHGFEDRQTGIMCLSCHLIDAQHVEIQFSDDGRGIAAEHLGKVFDPFFTTKFGQGGSGLGMNIAYNLVTTVLGGKIHLSSDGGQGSCFTMVLPLTAPETEASQVGSHLATHS